MHHFGTIFWCHVLLMERPEHDEDYMNVLDDVKTGLEWKLILRSKHSWRWWKKWRITVPFHISVLSHILQSVSKRHHLCICMVYASVLLTVTFCHRHLPFYGPLVLVAPPASTNRQITAFCGRHLVLLPHQPLLIDRLLHSVGVTWSCCPTSLY